MKVGSDWSSDGFRLGGTFVINAGGEEILLSLQQTKATDMVDNADILNALAAANLINESHLRLRSPSEESSPTLEGEVGRKGQWVKLGMVIPHPLSNWKASSPPLPTNKPHLPSDR